MKVYAIKKTDDEYATIYGIFDNIIQAEYAKRLFATDEIEEFELNHLPNHPTNMLMFGIVIHKDGSDCLHYNSGYQIDPLDFHGKTRDEFWRPTDGRDIGHATFTVWAKDREDALRIAKERRLQLIASGEWTTDYETWKSRQVKVKD